MGPNLISTLKGCRSWDDLQNSWGPLSKEQKGYLFEELVKFYLILEPEYSSKLRNVWRYKEVPPRVCSLLSLPSIEKGADLIAETNEGEYWSIQCKYISKTNQVVPWGGVSKAHTFTFNTCRGFSFLLYASTTERITTNIRESSRVGFLCFDVWQGLDKVFFNRLQARLKHKKEPLKPRLPRPHQKEALKDAIAYFAKNSNTRGKLIMPCGTGKSLTSYFIAQGLKARKVLIAVPSLALIKQTLKEWMRESMARSQDVEWICVCSDESAGKVQQDDIAVLTQDLGVPCYTDSRKIADWLKRKHASLTIVFTTYSSGDVLSKAAKRADFPFDLGIIDEAHRTTGTEDKLFSHLLQEKNISIRRRLFMTATERRYRGSSEKILSMDDPSIYGKTIHELSFKRALEYRPPILSDYKLLTIHISKDEVADLIRNRAFLRPKGWSKETESATLMALAAFRNAIQRYPIRHAVSFHRAIERAVSFAACNEAYTKSFPKGKGMITKHVSSKIPAGTRARIISEFSQASRALITNARCLTEGVDVPNIDAILFADPRKSLIDIVQAIGRALRPSRGKRFGYVIVPVFHERDATMDQVIESSSFKEVLQTIRALGSHDSRIIEFFRAISRGEKPRNGSPVDIVLGERLARKVDLKEFSKKIHLRSWDRLAKLSWMPFKEARAFIRKLGLRNNSEWQRYIDGNLHSLPPLPPDIPKTPRIVYEKEGWLNLGDWLGTGVVAPHRRIYMPFKEARRLIRSKNLKSHSEYAEYLKEAYKGKVYLSKPLPSAPDVAYQGKGWAGWGDFLGTNFVPYYNRKYKVFAPARQFVHSLKLKSFKEWKNFKTSRKFPSDIPKAPDLVYKGKGWLSWGDWLGTGRIAASFKKYRPFKGARDFVLKLKLKNRADWESYCKGRLPGKPPKPDDIPRGVERTYRNKGFISFGHFIGTGYVQMALRKFLNYEEAKKIVSVIGIKSSCEWNRWKTGALPGAPRFDDRIPRAPHLFYPSKGVTFSWGDFLGYKSKSLRKG